MSLTRTRPFSAPYIRKTSERVGRIFRKYNVNIAHKLIFTSKQNFAIKKITGMFLREREWFIRLIAVIVKLSIWGRLVGRSMIINVTSNVSRCSKTCALSL